MAVEGQPPVDWKKATQGRVYYKNEATEIITSAIEKSTKDDVIDMEAAARLIKDQLDRSQGPYWHCIIGKGFSSDIMSQKNNLLFMYFSGTMAVLLWKC